LYKGKHILIDCCNVANEVCLDDRRMLDVMACAATKAGATVISQVRYHFGHNSPPGFTAVVLLDESHMSAHCYADTGQIALDIFTCGTTDPKEVLRYIREEIDLGTVTFKEELRFVTSFSPDASCTARSHETCVLPSTDYLSQNPSQVDDAQIAP